MKEAGDDPTPRSTNRTLPNPLTQAHSSPRSMSTDCAQRDRRGLMNTSAIENASPESTLRETTQSEKMELMGVSHLYGRGCTTRYVFLSPPIGLTIVIPS